jgi:hypothetical protein
MSVASHLGSVKIDQADSLVEEILRLRFLRGLFPVKAPGDFF